MSTDEINSSQQIEDTSSQEDGEKSSTLSQEDGEKAGSSSSGQQQKDEIVVTGYVHKLSPKKPLKRKIGEEYYNLIIQKKDEVQRVVSYRTDLYEKFSKAAKAKSPLKIKGHKCVPNYFDNTKCDIEISNNTFVVDTDDVDFEHSLPGTEFPPITTIESLEPSPQDSKKCSLQLYMNVEDHPLMTTSSKFHSRPVPKKEVAGNDATGSVKVNLYNTAVKAMGTNGVYELLNAAYRTFGSTVIIYCNDNTDIKKIEDDVVAPVENAIVDQELETKNHKFPPESVLIVEQVFNCPLCDGTFAVEEEDHKKTSLKCGCCKINAKSSKFKVFYNLVLTFSDHGLVQIRMYRFDVESYFSSRKMTVPREAQECIDTMLDDENSVIICSARNRFIGIQSEAD